MAAVALSSNNGLDKSLSPENEYTGGRLLLLLDLVLKECIVNVSPMTNVHGASGLLFLSLIYRNRKYTKLTMNPNSGHNTTYRYIKTVNIVSDICMLKMSQTAHIINAMFGIRKAVT